MSFKIKNLSFRYLDEDKYAIKNINLDFQQGEFVLITGPTGCGKSTLLKCLNGLIPHHHSGYYSGTVTINGLDTKTVEVFELAPQVGLVFQNPEDQLVSFTVEKELAFGLENLGMPQEEMRNEIARMLNLLNMESFKNQAPQDLSGGQQQLLAIGSVLILNPTMLCLDEPSSNLDPLTARHLFETIHELSRKYSFTTIVVEHRLDLLLPYLTRVVVMDEGTVIHDGDPIEVLMKDDLPPIGINLPLVIRILKYLKANGISIGKAPRDIDAIIQLLKTKTGGFQ